MGALVSLLPGLLGGDHLLERIGEQFETCHKCLQSHAQCYVLRFNSHCLSHVLVKFLEHYLNERV